MEEEDCPRQAAFYGLTDGLEPKSRTTPGLLSEDSGENVLDVDPDVDPDSDQTRNDSLSEPASPAPDAATQLPLDEVEPEKPEPAKPQNQTGPQSSSSLTLSGNRCQMRTSGWLMNT